MPGARRSHGFTALRIEGGILPPEFLQSVAALEAPRQAGADYGLSKSLAIKEELARYWRIGSDLYVRYAERRPRRDLRSAQVDIEEWLVPFLRSLLGYDDLASSGAIVLDDRVFNLSHHACGGAVPLLLVTRDFDLDKADLRLGQDGRRQAAHGTMQEYLNAEDAALWGMVSNGSKLRLLRDNASLTRPSYIEADLDLIFAEELYPDFAALWLTAHASRLKPLDYNPSSCVIEAWRAKAHETGERVRENLRDGVADALRQLGNGFLQHPANSSLRNALEDGTLSPDRYFQQLLRLVYRLLFLFTAEERDLLHEPDATDAQRAVFAEGYSLSRLRERALRRRHYDRNQDLWQGLSITFHALADGAPGLGLPPLDGLFRSEQCPDLDSSAIANERLLEAVHTLAFFRSDTTLARINYRDMDTEELGSVYESLLELRPVIDVAASPWRFAFAGDGGGRRTKGSERKLTGSYYTPPALVGELVKSTLNPVIAEAVAARPEDPRAAILALRIVDPACGSGHFLLAAARRLAAEIARIESDADTSDESARQHALREVVQHCIYGVDHNPLAVELCKTALWMETVEPGKPLTFLDSHIVQGDSLVGILDPAIMANGIPVDAYKALTGDDKGVCTALRKRNRQSDQYGLFDEEAVLDVAIANVDLDAMPEDTLQDVERKRVAWETALGNETRAREALRANLFVGAWFAAKTRDTLEIVPQTEDLNRLNNEMPKRRRVEDLARELAETHRFLHWHLAFAEIMQDGGFDAVLGNPPWEVSQLNEEEYFAVRAPSIARLAGASRKRAIGDLEQSDPQLWAEYQSAVREYGAKGGFYRGSGRYSLSTYGKLNSYALFAEVFLQLLNSRGRAGLIVPSGIATDHSTKTYFEHIVSQRRLVSLFDFENREKVFPGIDSRIKFCLLTLSGKDRPVPEAEFAFFLHQAEQLKEAERRFSLSAEDFSLFKPNTRTCPIFRTRRDMEIARKMYRRAGVLWKEPRDGEPEANPWGISFMQMFNMTSDSGLFRTRSDLTDEGWELQGNVFVRGEERYLPLYEAKLFHQYDHRFATFDGVSDQKIRNGNARPMTVAEKSDSLSVTIPRYWVPEKEVAKRLDKGESTDNSPFLEQSRAEQSRAEQSRAEQSRAEQSRAEQSRAEQSRAEQSRAERLSTSSPHWLAARSQKDYKGDRRADGNLRHDSDGRTERFRNNDYGWIVLFRDIARSTDYRTAIFVAMRGTAVSNKAPLLNIDHYSWLQAFRGITNSTNERTFLSNNLPRSGAGNSAPVIDYENARAVASALVLANMNSLPLDWAARFSVGGVNMNFFIVKQLPVLPPDAYLEQSKCGRPWVQLIVPWVLELTYTSEEMFGFAEDLGYRGLPFPWDERRRHCLRSQLDATFASMYGLDRADLEWILDALPPSSSFPSLKQHELKEFGEYRTERLVLQAFDSLERGAIPDLIAEMRE